MAGFLQRPIVLFVVLALICPILPLSVPSTDSLLLRNLEGKSFLVVGGTGRVGGSVARVLQQNGARRVSVGGRTNVVGGFSVGGNDRFDFVNIDKDDRNSLSTVSWSDFDLVVNTAGPFQGKTSQTNLLLSKCIEASVPYIDVCDDFETATRAKWDFHSLAEDGGVPVILSTGCWPGVSSLMAKALLAAQFNDTDPSEVSCKFQFYTAGSGNAGVTLLVATFLILAEKALKIKNGVKTFVQPMDAYERIDFGERVGEKFCAPLNLLETASVAETLKIGSVEAIFGTAPTFWNSLLGFSAKFPPSLLSHESLMRSLSTFSMPIVRFVDKFAGAVNAMRVDLTDQKTTVSATYAHIDLEPCVGECVAAFAAAILTEEVGVRPGIWFTEEAIDDEFCPAVLEAASVNAFTKSTSGVPSEQVWGAK